MKSTKKDSTSFEPLLNLQEASAILGMHAKTLETKAREQKIPAIKVGKRWRFRLSSLNNWVENELQSSTTIHAAITGEEQHP